MKQVPNQHEYAMVLQNKPQSKQAHYLKILLRKLFAQLSLSANISCFWPSPISLWLGRPQSFLCGSAVVTISNIAWPAVISILICRKVRICICFAFQSIVSLRGCIGDNVQLCLITLYLYLNFICICIYIVINHFLQWWQCPTLPDHFVSKFPTVHQLSVSLAFNLGQTK